MIVAIYTDGGVIKKNPSSIGGTWAWCAVNEEGSNLRSDEGVIDIATARTWGLEAVTNNLTELYALCKAMTSLPDGWSGTVYSDSQISLGRLFLGYKKWEGIPDELREWAQTSVARLGTVKPVLLDGHPTRAQLAAGIGKRGNPCSAHNVWCDEQCTRVGKQYLSTLK